MGNFWKNLTFQRGFKKSLDPFEIFTGGDESQIKGLELPKFQEDPDYRKTQDYLRDLGINILGGEIPDYYKKIGEPVPVADIGGPEFENYLSLMTGDIKKSALETAAASGRGGGAVQDITNQAVGEFTTQSRYANFLREIEQKFAAEQNAIEGRKFLFGEGRGITEGVRTAGLQQEGLVNQFALNRAELDFRKRSSLDKFEQSQDLLSGENLGKFLNLGVNAGVGFAKGGLKGALAGAMGRIDWGEIFDEATKSKTADLYSGPVPRQKERLGSVYRWGGIR